MMSVSLEMDVGTGKVKRIIGTKKMTSLSVILCEA